MTNWVNQPLHALASYNDKVRYGLWLFNHRPPDGLTYGSCMKRYMALSALPPRREKPRAAESLAFTWVRSVCRHYRSQGTPAYAARSLPRLFERKNAC